MLKLCKPNGGGSCRSALPFLLLLAAFGLLCGWKWLAASLLAAALHEGGHLLALQSFGAGEGRLLLGPAGLEWRQTGRRLLSYPQELAVLLAGPAANVLFAFLLARLAREALWPEGYFFAGTQVVLGAFNLLPILPLDGGRVLETLLAWLTEPFFADRVAGAVSLAAAVLLAGAGVWLLARTGSAFLLIGAAGLLCLTARETGLAKAWENR